MALTQRQMNCFERNSQFLNEVAAALLPIAADLKRAAIVALNNPDATQVDRAFAETQTRIAEQILAEQGITLHASSVPTLPNTGSAAGGSTAMKYLVQQMLMAAGWTLTPDEWAGDEPAARATIQGAMAALITALTAQPEAGA